MLIDKNKTYYFHKNNLSEDIPSKSDAENIVIFKGSDLLTIQRLLSSGNEILMIANDAKELYDVLKSRVVTRQQANFLAKSTKPLRTWKMYLTDDEIGLYLKKVG